MGPTTDSKGGTSEGGRATAAAEPLVARAAAERLSVFISYSRRDSLDFARQLAKALEFLGYDTIIDLQGISGAEEWRPRLGEMILEADTIVFVLSPESATSPVCAWEVEEAERRSKRIVPVVAMALGDAKPPTTLQRLNYIHFYAEPKVPESGFGYGIAKLDAALKADLGWLRQHRDVLLRAEAWAAKARDADRLLRGSALAEAERWATSRPVTAPDLTELQRTYLAASRAAEDEEAADRSRALAEREHLLQEAEAAQKREAVARAEREAEAMRAADAARREADAAQRAAAASRRVTFVSVAGGTLAMALAVTALVYYRSATESERKAVHSATQAEQAATKAKTAEQEAVKRRDEALRAQSRYLADLSLRFTEQEHDATAGALIALEALPDPTSTDEALRSRPYVPEAEVALNVAMSKLREIRVIDGHRGWISGLAALPGGERIATSSWDRTVRITDAGTGQTVAELKGHSRPIRSVVAWPDGSRLATGAADGVILIWDVATGAELFRLTGHTAAVTSLILTPDGKRVLSGAADKSIHVWDTQTGRSLASIADAGAGVTSLAMFPGGQKFLAGLGNGFVKVFDVIGGPSGTAALKLADGPLTSIAVSRDGERIFVGSDDHTVQSFSWDRARSTFGVNVSKLLAAQAGVTSLALDAHGTHLAVGSSDGRVRIVRLASKGADIEGTQIEQIAAHPAIVASVAFSPGSDRLLTGGRDATVRVWNVKNLLAPVGTSPDTNSASALRSAKRDERLVSPDGRWELSGAAMASRAVTGSSSSARRAIELRNVQTGQSLVLTGHTGVVESFMFTADSRRVVTGSRDGTARVWDVETGAEKARIEGRSGWLTHVVPSADGTTIVTGSIDGLVRTFDLATGAEVTRPVQSKGSVQDLSITVAGIVSVRWNTNITREWGLLPVGPALVDHARNALPRCLLPERREQLGLPLSSPNWCNSFGKWPFVKPGSDPPNSSSFEPERRVALIPGHDRERPGGQALSPPFPPDTYEFTISVPLLEDIIRNLQSHGVMSRMFYREFGIAEAHDDVARWRPHATIELHWNSGPPQARGTETLYGRPEGRLLAETVQRSMVAALERQGRHDRGILYRGDGGRGAENVATETQPTVLLETLFITSLEDSNLYFERRQQIIDSLADALTEYVSVDHDFASYGIDIHISRGGTLLKARKDDEAKVEFDRAVALDPSKAGEVSKEWAKAFLERGKALLENGQEERATAEFDLALSHDPAIAADIAAASADARIERGEQLLTEGKPAEARSQFERAVLQGPAGRKSWVHRLIAESYYREDLFDDALRAITAAIDTAGNADLFLEWRALINLALGRLEAACVDADAALADDEDKFGAAVVRARCLENRGDRAGAIAEYRRVLEADAYVLEHEVAHQIAEERLKSLGVPFERKPDE